MAIAIEVHPAAELFPLIAGEELASLAADIAANGLLEPLVTWEGKLLDGRNRLAACAVAGVSPRYRALEVCRSPVAYVLSANLHRRHLSAGQRAELALGVAVELAVEAKARQREHGGTAPGRRADTSPYSMAKCSTHAGKALRQAAAAVGAGATSVERLKAAVKVAPEVRAAVASGWLGVADAVAIAELPEASRASVLAAVEGGTTTIADAIREIKRTEIKARLDDVSTRKAKALAGVFDVLVIDPPWPMKKIERDVTPNQSEFEYPTMSEEELGAVLIPAADDCHVWLWTTHRFLPMALRLLERWGLKYVCTFVWHKAGGFQPFGLPQYNCEFALYARKGVPKFVDTKAFPVCFTAARGKHSEKPEEFYGVVRRVTAGRRADMFNRRAIEGFEGWGNES